MSFQRALRRSWYSLRSASAASLRTLSQPQQWNWRRIGVASAVVVAGGAFIAANERIRSKRLSTENRVFNEGSPLVAIESSLHTGDILLFSRSLMHDPLGPASCSLHPMRFLLVLLQKLQGRSEFDHVAMVMLRNDYPYLLERSIDGSVHLRPFDARVLHASANEILLRRMEYELTEEQEARLEKWMEKIVTPNERQRSTDATTAASSNPPRLPPFALLRHLLLVQLFPSASTASFGSNASATASSTSDPLVLLGQMTELWGEAQGIAAKIRSVSESERQQQTTVAASARTSKAATVNPTLQRLTLRHREVCNRLAQLQSMLDATAPFPASAPAVAADPDAVLGTATDFPSATLVARALQVMGLLPDARGSSLTLPLDQPTAPPTKQQQAQAQTLRIAASHIPPASAYAPRHFLSSSHLPLLDVDAMRSKQPSAEYAPANSAAAVTTAAAATTTAISEVFLHREMFIKTKPLPFTVQE